MTSTFDSAPTATSTLGTTGTIVTPEEINWGSFVQSSEPDADSTDSIVAGFASLLAGGPTAQVSNAVLRSRLAIADLDVTPDHSPAERLARHLYEADDWDLDAHWDDADPSTRGHYLSLIDAIEAGGWGPITAEATHG